MKHLLTLSIVLSILGCQDSDKNLQQENQVLIEENNSLKREMSEMNLSGEETMQDEDQNFTEALSALAYSVSVITSDTLPEIIYENLVSEEYSAGSTEYQFLYRFSLLANPNRNTTSKFETDGSIKDVLSYASYTGNYDYYLHYLWKSIDRSPENIRFHFDRNKTFAYSLLKLGNAYRTSGFENTVKILLLSYREIGKQNALLADLYERTESFGVLADTIYNGLESDKMNALISEFRDSEYVSYSSWAYSFWMRRFKENNAEVVYEILKEFDNEMGTYEFVDDEEEYYEGY